MSNSAKKGIMVFVAIFLAYIALIDLAKGVEIPSEEIRRANSEIYAQYMNDLLKEKMVSEVSPITHGKCVFSATLQGIGYMQGIAIAYTLAREDTLSYEFFLNDYIEFRNKWINACLNEVK